MKSSIVTTCNPTKPCLPNFHIVPLICSFQEIEIRHFFWYTNNILGVKAKVRLLNSTSDQTIKHTFYERI